MKLHTRWLVSNRILCKCNRQRHCGVCRFFLMKTRHFDVLPRTRRVPFRIRNWIILFHSSVKWIPSDWSKHQVIISWRTYSPRQIKFLTLPIDTARRFLHIPKVLLMYREHRRSPGIHARVPLLSTSIDDNTSFNVYFGCGLILCMEHVDRSLLNPTCWGSTLIHRRGLLTTHRISTIVHFLSQNF